ncbi:glycosyltransferase family 9 protein [Chitinophagaceae bacterium LB-8]|uniref:Glycosyltransferase family 9 protein n=1 Tax=Paraflavisolibacter caeni TaxID=2982496 RepID=A0A9X2XXP3_9BACT|nr:glycosyltransferase family 9 protein [Paraflavisolibacter caeni]MCU7551010.1 glycosyltransferase family 9 protein [Paraflavisolibacter caeni]
MKKSPRNILISRTDSIGDVVLTLPVAAVLKEHFPDMTIGFMGKSYTRPVIEACRFVDEYVDVDDFMNREVLLGGQPIEAIIHVFPVSEISFRARSLGIPNRIGTTNRLYHLPTCNKLVKLSRKNSNLHEAQLNIALLKPLGIQNDYSLEQIESMFGLDRLELLRPEFKSLIDTNSYNLILHPKSQGSGREWPLQNYIKLIQSLDQDRFKIFVSGTPKEQKALQPLFEEAGDRVTNITGKMDLSQFLSFIQHCDGLVASGTGPVHLAAVLGKDALGMYPPIRPVHPGRWQPIGPKAKVFALNKDCNDCKKSPKACHCIEELEPLWVKCYLEEIANMKVSC